jgi:HTH-type transcriptional regulator/antitoxin HigA
MQVRPIKSEDDYRRALDRVDLLWGSGIDTPEGDELDLWITLVEMHEMRHYPVAPPDPVDAIKFRMEQMDLSNADISYIYIH